MDTHRHTHGHTHGHTHTHTHTHTYSESTVWGAVWNCYVAAAYELTQMVSPSATLQTHLSHWVSVCVCARQCQCAVAYVCAHARVFVWGWENCLTPLHLCVGSFSKGRLPAPVSITGSRSTKTKSGICLQQRTISDNVAKGGLLGDKMRWKWGWGNDKSKRPGFLSSPYHLSPVAFSRSVPFHLPCRSEKIHRVLCIRGLWMI